MIKVKIIKFLAEVGAIKRVNIRFLGESKLWVGRVVQGLVKSGQVEEFKVGKVTYIRLSLIGYRKAFGCIKAEQSFEPKETEQKSDSTGRVFVKTNVKKEGEKIFSEKGSEQVHVDNELSFEPKETEQKSDSTSRISVKTTIKGEVVEKEKGPAQEPTVSRQLVRQRAYEHVLKRASAANNVNKQERYEREIEILAYFYRYWAEGTLVFGLNSSAITARYIEMNDIKRSDEKKGMLIRGSRGHGILELKRGIFVIYNSKNQKLKKYSLNEDKLFIYLERRFEKKVIGTLVLGTERVLKQLYDSDIRGRYVGENEEGTKGVYMGEDGAKQIGVYIYGTRDKLRDRLISPHEQEMANSYLYDGLNNNSGAKYIAIEEDLYEIKTIRETAVLQGISKIELYCFERQKERIEGMINDIGIPVEIKTLKEQDILKKEF